MMISYDDDNDDDDNHKNSTINDEMQDIAEFRVTRVNDIIYVTCEMT